MYKQLYIAELWAEALSGDKRIIIIKKFNSVKLNM